MKIKIVLEQDLQEYIRSLYKKADIVREYNRYMLETIQGLRGVTRYEVQEGEISPGEIAYLIYDRQTQDYIGVSGEPITYTSPMQALYEAETLETELWKRMVKDESAAVSKDTRKAEPTLEITFEQETKDVGIHK